jgi:hypothetical protein
LGGGAAAHDELGGQRGPGWFDVLAEGELERATAQDHLHIKQIRMLSGRRVATLPLRIVTISQQTGGLAILRSWRRPDRVVGVEGLAQCLECSAGALSRSPRSAGSLG